MEHRRTAVNDAGDALPSRGFGLIYALARCGNALGPGDKPTPSLVGPRCPRPEDGVQDAAPRALWSGSDTQNLQVSVDTVQVSPTNGPHADTVVGTTLIKPKSYRGKLLLKAMPTVAVVMC